jgi:16S rRNA (cytidine1402-2'-O)-methyltransferase
MFGTLYVVATPIGNLEDMTFRAVRTLKEVSVIACEDTRQTRKLLEHFSIATRLVSYHDHNERERTGELIAALEAGSSIALVSDAGTPLVSDPGFHLVQAAVARRIPVVPIPGASAAMAALSAAGLATDGFCFAGFLSPKTSQRRKELEAWKQEPLTVILYEAPHRILATLTDIAEVLGPDRQIVIGRELTKLHEEFLRGSATQLHDELARRAAIKGEMTVLIGPAPPQPLEPATDAGLRAEVDALIEQGTPRMDAIKQVAARHGLGKRDVYKVIEGEER